MIKIEESKLYKRVKDYARVRVHLDEKSGLSDLMADVQFRQLLSFPNDDLDDPIMMENHAKSLAENMVYTILEQCGITRRDYQILIFCMEFIGKDRYDYIPTYRGCRMGSCNSRHEESSGVVGEER